MNNESVAWYNADESSLSFKNHGGGWQPLYTQDQLEEARKLGMQQERALWNLSTSTQEIMEE